MNADLNWLRYFWNWHSERKKKSISGRLMSLNFHFPTVQRARFKPNKEHFCSLLNPAKDENVAYLKAFSKLEI